jgi:hypothetical protein
MAAMNDQFQFDPDPIYDQFPEGASNGFGPEQGFNTFVRLNDETLFTDEARQNPVIQEFLAAPFSVTYVQLKSSTRESEWFIHKPHLAMAGEVSGFSGRVDLLPDNPHKRHIGTYVINHDMTLGFRIMRSVVIEDGRQAGQIIHKEAEDGS